MDTAQSQDRLYSISEIAKILRVSIGTLRRWEKTGRLISVRTAGGHRRYTKESLEFLKAAREIPQQQTTRVLVEEPVYVAPPVRFPFKKVVLLTALSVIAVFILQNVSEIDKILQVEPAASKPQVLATNISTDLPVFRVNIQSNYLENASFEKDVEVLGTLTAENLTTNASLTAQTVSATGAVTGTTGTFSGSLTTTSLVTNATTFNLINTNAITLNIGGAATTLSIGATSGTTTINNNLSVTGTSTLTGKLTTSGDLVVGGNIDINGSGTHDIAGTLNLSGNSLTSGGDLTINPGGGDVILADGDVINIGGSGSDTDYSVIGDSTSGASASMDSDDDLYIEGNLEVDGTIVGTLSGTLNPGLTEGSVLFQGPLGISGDSTNFFWNDTDNILRIGSGAKITPSVDLGSDLGTASLRWNNIYAANLTIDSGFTSSGQLLVTYNPTDTTFAQSSIRINVTTPAANEQMLGIGQAGAEMAAIDAEGDLTIGYSGGAGTSIPASSNPFSVYDHSTTEIFTIEAGGEVGIGTATPQRKLDVASSNIRISDSFGLEWGLGDVFVHGSTASDYLRLATGGANRLAIDTTGNVGIGSDTTPDTQLEIFNATTTPTLSLTDDDIAHGVTTLANTDAFFHLTSFSTTDGGAQLTAFADNVNTAQALSIRGILGNTPDDTVPAIKFIGAKGSGTGIVDLAAAETVFQVANNDETSALTILGDGKVGIGDTTPSQELEVAGDITLTGNIIGDATDSLRLQAGGTTVGASGNSSIFFLDSSGTVRGRFDTATTGSYLGSGADGAVTISTSKNMNTATIAGGRTFADGIAYRVIAPVAGATTVTRFSGSDTISNGIAAGDELLIINLQGIDGDSADAGKYEFVEVSSVTSSVITFTRALINDYDGTTASNQKVVVQRVPNYTTVSISSGGTLTASAWDGLTTTPTGAAGYLTGIVAFRATGAVTVSSGGSISASSLGYRGGAGGDSFPVDGGDNGESYEGSNGEGGNGATGETKGGGRGSDGATTSPNNGAVRTGGGGGGSASNDCGSGGGGGGGGNGGGGGGGAGGGGSGGGGCGGASPAAGGTGGTGSGTNVNAGGGGGGGGGGTVGGAGGTSAAGTSSTGTGGQVGNGTTSGSGAGGTASNVNGSGGGGGGGLSTTTPGALDRMFLGGGGGGGGGDLTGGAGTSGGIGGGIIFMGASTLSVQGTIVTSGAAAGTSNAGRGGGGAGAGGIIYIQSGSATVGSSLTTAAGSAASAGAAGSGTNGGGGGGGGGGTGVIRIEGPVVGTTNPTAATSSVYSQQALSPTGTPEYGVLYASAVNTSSADLAEYYVAADRSIEPGDVVIINSTSLSPKGMLEKAATPHDSRLLGIISSNPGVVLGSVDGETGKADARQVALAGRVPVKIDPDSEAIAVGDFLTSSDKPGMARKAVQSGYTIGKALEAWNPTAASGSTTIEVFVNLGYYMGKMTADGFIDTGTLFAAKDVKIDVATSSYQRLFENNAVATDPARNASQSDAGGSAEVIDVSEAQATTTSVSLSETLTKILEQMQNQKTPESLNTLTVLGATTLGDTLVNGKLSVGTLMFDNLGNSIDAVGTLKIQPMALGPIEFMNGKVVIDQDGNITANKYKVSGASAGTTKLLKDENSVDVATDQITEQSRVFVTATTLTSSVLTVTEKTPGIGFKVEIISPAAEDITFDWWIVDQ